MRLLPAFLVNGLRSFFAIFTRKTVQPPKPNDRSARYERVMETRPNEILYGRPRTSDGIYDSRYIKPDDEPFLPGHA